MYLRKKNDKKYLSTMYKTFYEKKKILKFREDWNSLSHPFPPGREHTTAFLTY